MTHAHFAVVCAPPRLPTDAATEAHYPQLDTVQSYDDNAVVAHTPDDKLQHYACASTVVTLLGTIDNDAELRQWTLGNAPPLSSAAELIAKLYRQRKYHAFSSLRGKFAFALLDRTTGTAVGARSACGTFPLFQGKHAATGGLLLTSCATLEDALTRITPGTFVFGNKAGRLPHNIGESHVGPVAQEAKAQAANAAAAAMAGLKLNVAKPATVVVAAYMLPEGNNIASSSMGSRSTSGASLVSLAESDECTRSIRSVSGSTTCSAADRAPTWRKSKGVPRRFSSHASVDISLPSSVAASRNHSIDIKASRNPSLDINAPSFEPSSSSRLPATPPSLRQVLEAALKVSAPVALPSTNNCSGKYVPPHSRFTHGHEVPTRCGPV